MSKSTPKKTIFWGYPSHPGGLKGTIEATAEKLNKSSSKIKFITWPKGFRQGLSIPVNIIDHIEQSCFTIFDITVPNPNVFYEIGFAYAKQKGALLTVNSSLEGAGDYLNEFGLFDTMGLTRYSNSDELVKQVAEAASPPIVYSGVRKLDRSQPLYILDAAVQTDSSMKIVASVKEGNIFYRSFDPKEESRMSLRRELQGVSSSTGIIVSLLDDLTKDSASHNCRAGFLAGLADGMGVPKLVLNMRGTATPIDVRDDTKRVGRLADIQRHIVDFLPCVVAGLQERSPPIQLLTQSSLAFIQIGAPAAENEFRKLGEYFIETHAFRQALEGRGRLVVGRKGSGKTAIFWQVRDRKSAGRSTIVLDLKPDGYQLRKFKDLIVVKLSEGSKEHTVAAFWEYVLWKELCRKVIDRDREAIGRDQYITVNLPKLEALYRASEYDEEGDFSERLAALLKHICERLEDIRKDAQEKSILSTGEISQIVHRQDIRPLKHELAKYLATKDSVVILVDNIDKGWEAQGVSGDDLIIVRTLLEAMRKIERNLESSPADFQSLLFLRNDVYELLLGDTPDRGKDGAILIDWNNRSLLKALIDRRILAAAQSNGTNGSQSWTSIATPWMEEEDSLDWLIDRSLMRPRYLIELVDRCLGYAISMGMDQVDASSLRDGYQTFSNYVLQNTNFEIRDIFPSAANAIYSLRTCDEVTSLIDIGARLVADGFQEECVGRIIELFLWFGVLGIPVDDSSQKYIYDVDYNRQMLEGLRKKLDGDGELFCVNKAFHYALSVKTVLKPKNLRFSFLA